MNEELKKLSKEQLIELAEIYSKNWLACDGLWFQAVEKHQGMDGAMDCDKEIWRSFTVTEAKRIKEFLSLPERAGLKGLAVLFPGIGYSREAAFGARDQGLLIWMHKTYLKQLTISANM